VLPTAEPTLTRRDVPHRPAGLVLMLHGGQPNGSAPVDERSASWRRSRWMMSHVQQPLARAGVSVWLLRYGVRGWNAPRVSPPSPVGDARWALDVVRREVGAVPVVLLGHSMGARTAVAVADEPNVAGVVALAPWLPATEPVAPLTGKRLVAAHGRTDRITSAQQTRDFCRAAETVAESVEVQDMGDVGHYMLRRVQRWNRFAVTRALSMLSS
jgi:predicted alpha/beta-hydrolase family hydrolase